MRGFLNRVSIARDVRAIVQRILNGAFSDVALVEATYLAAFCFVETTLVNFFEAVILMSARVNSDSIVADGLVAVIFVAAAG
ncbi:hypothetical protein GN958_ATG14523 [Phytophthora infestans]|uniref:Uncharacterized protein n=1 Tax=Phytophthora infestans TaxID=4787 RepID=A0A8S9U5Z8_PHYIN|nr:hypothetical protein GN958_ATG14523 [Phytophthora infestans]